MKPGKYSRLLLGTKLVKKLLYQMLRITRSNTAQDLIVTLSEKIIGSSLTRHFLFYFINDSTSKAIKFIKPETEDTGIVERYNKFTINASVVFSLCPLGFYKYYIYEQFEGSDLSITGKKLLECGKMQLVGTGVNYIENTTLNITFIQNEN